MHIHTSSRLILSTFPRKSDVLVLASKGLCWDTESFRGEDTLCPLEARARGRPTASWTGSRTRRPGRRPGRPAQPRTRTGPAPGGWSGTGCAPLDNPAARDPLSLVRDACLSQRGYRCASGRLGHRLVQVSGYPGGIRRAVQPGRPCPWSVWKRQPLLQAECLTTHYLSLLSDSVDTQ